VILTKRKMSPGWLALAFLVAGAGVVLPACSSSDGPTPPESLSACTGDWQTLVPSITDWQKLTYANGRLYYDDQWSGIWYQPATGGSSTSVASFPPSAFGHAFRAADYWIEGDQIVYTAGDRENQFYGAALAGGDPQLLLDVGAQNAGAGWAQFHALTPGDFVWTESPDLGGGDTTSVWHAPRSAPVPAQIGIIHGLVVGMGVAGGAALVAVDGGATYSFSLDGSGARALATTPELTAGPATFIGMDGDGVFWTIPRPGAAPTDALYTVLFVPADGGPVRTFWNSSPSHAVIEWISPDGQGGWIAIVDQLFTEGFASSIYAIDARANARRLACSPLGRFVPPYAPAIAPDALFLVTLQDGAQYEQIDRIPR
jgi:hypothetical protein